MTLRRNSRKFVSNLAAAAILLVGGGAALAQSAEVSMVRQDFSDCQNANVSDSDPARVGGTVILSRQTDGTTAVKVWITGTPNTKYNFFLKCVRSLGTITTYDEGEGEGLFTFRTNETGNVYAFDMYPDGAPAGNKFQSVQVKC